MIILGCLGGTTIYGNTQIAQKFPSVQAEACHQHLDFGSKIGTFDPRAHWCHAREARCGSGALEPGA